jgi:glyceraldehyde 3-phosphate dehydrogenase
MVRVAINGFGRIGRLAFREMITGTDFDVVAINDLSNAEDLAYLVKYDTAHGTFHENEISFDENNIIVGGIKKIRVFAEKDPSNLPWRDLNIDLVLECTGHFTDKTGMQKHIDAGAKKVLLSAPGKDEMPTIVYNVNENTLVDTDTIVSAASCTTNCLAPVVDVLNKEFGIEKGFMSTIHAFTNDQATQDVAHSKGIKSRRGRSCNSNIVPTSTGAAKAIGLVVPDLLGRMDGVAYRVPVIDGSMIDLALEFKRNVTKEEVNEALKNHQNETLKFTMEPLVSSDVINRPIGALVDGLLTQVIEVDGKQMVKVVAWYDNETGYTSQMLRTAKKMFNC